jgi:hypothetical protein
VGIRFLVELPFQFVVMWRQISGHSILKPILGDKLKFFKYYVFYWR